MSGCRFFGAVAGAGLPRAAPLGTQTRGVARELDLTVRSEFSSTFGYAVQFTRGALRVSDERLAACFRGASGGTKPARVLAVVDAGLEAARPGLLDELSAYARAHAEVFELVGTPLVVPGGEASKAGLVQVERVLAQVAAHGLDRHAYILALGGGAVLDMAGYAAAIAHRGLRLVRMPSTVLAQNDAGVGVKNGVNAFGGKNFLGTFAPPDAVLCDLDWLVSLEPRDRRAGMAEAVKVAVIKDAEAFAALERDAEALSGFEDAAVADMVIRAAEAHVRHIEGGGDPFERGSSRPLDYGHWSAHKLELLSEHSLRHGEAVAIGMALDAEYAHVEGWLDAESLERLHRLLEALGLPGWHEALALKDADGRRAVYAGLEEFRQHLGGRLCVTMLEAIGRAREVDAIDLERMDLAVSALERRRR